MRAPAAPSSRSAIRAQRSHRHDTGVVRRRCFASESPELIAKTRADAAWRDLGLEERYALAIGRLRSCAGERGRRIQLECASIAKLGPRRLTAALVNGAFLTQQRRIHAETVHLVLADQLNRAGGIDTFQNRAHRPEDEIACLLQQDHGQVKVASPDEVEYLGERLRSLLDHSLDVVALNDAHEVKGIWGLL